jgi:ATP-dependent Clp protease adaptor protein ClpS
MVRRASDGPAITRLNVPVPATAAPETSVLEEPTTDQVTLDDRPWVVIVWNDPINLMSYVTFVLQKLFGYSLDKATALMLDVHHKGKAVVASGSRYVLHLGRDERALVSRLLDELRALLTDQADPELMRRLFPVVHPDDPEREAEYQRLTRDDLVASRLTGIETVSAVLGRSGRKVTLDEAQMLAFMQAVNGVRLVLGTLLDVTEDDEDAERDDLDATPEYHLYGYLSWVLDSSVRALSGANDLP